MKVLLDTDTCIELARLQRTGFPIGSVDMLIGAHALSLGVTLVTHNSREFSRIAGLRLSDWAAEGKS